jgi:hypothetical protein
MPIRISAKFRKIRLLQEKPASSLSGAFFRLFLRVFYWIGRYSGFFSLNRT